MTNLAVKLSLSMASIMIISGCSYSSDELFPSLFTGDTQEEMSVQSSSDDVIPGLGSGNFEPVSVSEGNNTGTFVGQKVVTFRNELAQVQASIRANNEQLQQIRASVINNALQYHKVVGNIEAKLQVGTTPGNPMMYQMLQAAQNNVQVMNTNTMALSQLAQKVSSDTANTTYLADSIRAAYNISGAVDEDHRQLRILEGETNQTALIINSLLSEINNDVARQQQYIETAKNNISALGSAIKTGSYGVSNVPLNNVALGTYNNYSQSAGGSAVSGKPLMSIKFNKSKVDYKDALQKAVSSAKAKKANAMFNIVAISPAGGSQLSTAAAKNNATLVFQDMIDMGVGADRISLSARSGNVTSSEVQIFVK